MKGKAREIYFTTSEVAEILGLTVHTVRALIKKGRIKAIRIGRGWRIPSKELKK